MLLHPAEMQSITLIPSHQEAVPETPTHWGAADWGAVKTFSGQARWSYTKAFCSLQLDGMLYHHLPTVVGAPRGMKERGALVSEPWAQGPALPLTSLCLSFCISKDEDIGDTTCTALL